MPVSLVQFGEGGEWEVNYLDNKQLLANDSPHGLFRGLYRAHSQNVHVNCEADSDQEVAIDDREGLFDWSTSQAHTDPPIRNAFGSIANFLTERREIRLDQLSERAVEAFVQERGRWCLGCRSARFKGGDEISKPALSDSSEVQTMLILDVSDQKAVLMVHDESSYR